MAEKEKEAESKKSEKTEKKNPIDVKIDELDAQVAEARRNLGRLSSTERAVAKERESFLDFLTSLRKK